MKSIIALLFMSTVAYADATVKFSINGATMTVDVTRILSDENAARFVSYAKRAYSTVQVPPVTTGADCQIDPRPVGCDPTTRDTTPQEAVTSMISDNFAAMINNVTASEKRAAAVAAAAAIDPILPK